MDLIKVEPDDSSVSDVRDEEECEIPFIKTEAREIDFDWERKSETAHDGKKPGSVGDAATNTKEDEDKKAVDCHEMKSEVKEESITVEEWNDDTKALASETQLDRNGYLHLCFRSGQRLILVSEVDNVIFKYILKCFKLIILSEDLNYFVNKVTNMAYKNFYTLYYKLI
ncbi:uncharacterized protein [Periplaneta americana]|uniref:uncharacterized protein isoform X4 n=1 Tax=Periplaneta americana TaxID=6978 RepID=UPI0037E80F8C